MVGRRAALSGRANRPRTLLALAAIAGTLVDAGATSEGTCASETCRADPASKEQKSDCYEHATEDIVEWVRNHGGFVDKRLNIDGGVYGRGFFATDDINPGENIASVPEELILKDGKHPCHTVAMLRDELIKGKCSKYWPYLKFVQSVELDVPDAWSVEELQILDGLPPGDWRLHSTRMLKDCPEQKVDLPMNDPFAVKALFLYATRAGPEGMQPIFDIFNHGYNSTWHFMENRGKTNAKHTFQTKFPIDAGEEIFNQFRPGVGPGYEVVSNMVKHGREPDGAPEIFRDYGFMEPPPTMWYFKQNGRKHSFIIEDQNFTVTFLPKTHNWKRFAKDAQDYYKWLVAREGAFKDAGLLCTDVENPCEGMNLRRLRLGKLYRDTFKSALKAAYNAAKRNI